MRVGNLLSCEIWEKVYDIKFENDVTQSHRKINWRDYLYRCFHHLISPDDLFPPIDFPTATISFIWYILYTNEPELNLDELQCAISDAAVIVARLSLDPNYGFIGSQSILSRIRSTITATRSMRLENITISGNNFTLPHHPCPLSIMLFECFSNWTYRQKDDALAECRLVRMKKFRWTTVVISY